MQSNRSSVIRTGIELIASNPRSPLLMSSPSHWQNIGLVHLLQPPHKMTDACLPLHT
jgi:hypothetical protein